MKEEKSIVALNKELNKNLEDPAIVRALLATTFKGLTEQSMKQAALEGMIRGFKFKDFLEKNVYAIPYGDKYSLVTSIDYARKIGMRAGVVGKSAPSFTYDEKGRIESCTITVKRRVGQDIGEYTATVFFDEFTTGKNLWNSKPRVMLAKVAEMHALRMACPEEVSQLYTAEELEKEDEFDTEGITDDTVPTVHVGDDHGSPAPNLVVDRTSTEKAEMPETEEERLNLIKGLFVKRWPDLGAGMPTITKKVKDYCGVPLVAENYEVVINMLR